MILRLQKFIFLPAFLAVACQARPDHRSTSSKSESIDYARTENSAVAAEPATTAEAEDSKSFGLSEAKARSTPGTVVKTEENSKSGEETEQDHGRLIIYTASLLIAVHDVQQALRIVEKIPSTHGGWVHQLSDDSIVLRIPAKNLQAAMNSTSPLGELRNRSYEAQDITEEFADVETRIEVLRQTRDQLLALLKKAKNVKETLQVRERLDAITMELEAALGRLKVLKSLHQFSTLTISFEKIDPRIPHRNNPSPFPWVDQLGYEACAWD